ncbi:MAG TPA: hypothetical protein VFC63_22565 [Blastocatellia bacterium]|nr:hypothetical protein [Blastocatellia bacterium]
MSDPSETNGKLQLMKQASDALENAINFLEEAGAVDDIVLLLRTAENNLEDEVIKLEDQLSVQ